MEEEKKHLEELEAHHKRQLEEIVKKAPTCNSANLKAFNTLLHVDSRISTEKYYLEKARPGKKLIEDEEDKEESKEEEKGEESNNEGEKRSNSQERR